MSKNPTFFSTFFGFGNGSGNNNFKGYFANPTALTTAYPVGQAGWFAIVGSTDTVWVWDTGSVAWVNTGNTATGDVVGPVSATDNAIVLFDGITGKLIKSSSVLLSSKANTDSPAFTGAALSEVDVTANTGSAYTIDPANGAAFNLTMNAATPVLTLATAPAAGKYQVLYVRLIQDGVGGRVPSFVNATYASGAAPTVNPVPGSITYLSFGGNGQVWTLFSSFTPTNNLTVNNLTVNGTQTFAGVTNASTAAIGKVGEVVSSTLAIASATSLTTATAKTITSIFLTAGDWEIWGNIGFIAAAGTLPTVLEGSISATNNTQATSPNGGAYFRSALAFTASETQIAPIGRTVVNISSSATYYLVATATFTVSTLTGYGAIFARRIR